MKHGVNEYKKEIAPQGWLASIASYVTPSRWWQTPEITPQSGSDGVLKNNTWFLKTGYFGDNEINQAASTANLAAAQAAFANGVPIMSDFCRMNPLHLLATLGESNEVSNFAAWVIQNKPSAMWDLETSCRLPIAMATNSGNLSLFGLLLENMRKTQADIRQWIATPDNHNRTTAHAVCMGGAWCNDNPRNRINIVQQLMNLDVNFNVPDSLGKTALDYAALYYPYLVPFINQEAYDVPTTTHAVPQPTMQNYYGINGSQIAAMANKLILAKQYHADGIPFLVNDVRQSALFMLSCMHENLEYASWLYATIGQQDISDTNGIRPIHVAANNGLQNMFNYLLSQITCNINLVTDRNGRTPAHAVSLLSQAPNNASINDRIAIVDMLGQQIANFLQSDVFGISPLMYAEANFPDLVPTMKKYIQPEMQENYEKIKETTQQYQKIQEATEKLEQLQIGHPNSILPSPSAKLNI